MVYPVAFRDEGDSEEVADARSTNNVAVRNEIHDNVSGDNTTGKPNQWIDVTAHGTFL